jgi:hypothetical protein
MKKTTIIVIILATIFLIIYDVFAIIKGGTEASISSIIITWSYEMPLLPFAFGVLCGHFFWRMRSNEDTRKIDNAKNDNQ